MLSVCIITFNEEANIGRTLASVQELVRAVGGEVIVVDSGSTDRTRQVAESLGAKVFVEPWRGFAAQKNLAMDKAGHEWILSLDADEEVSPELRAEILDVLRPMVAGSTTEQKLMSAERIEYRFDRASRAASERKIKQLAAAGTSTAEQNALLAVPLIGYRIPRKNMFLGRWMRHGGFYPDRKLRLFQRTFVRFPENRLVHEDAQTDMPTGILRGALIHHAYPTLAGYIDHMNRYSSLGAEMSGARGFSVIDIFIRPRLTFFYNYILRGGFLDGREGFLLHLYHATYVSWKYAKAWEKSRRQDRA